MTYREIFEKAVARANKQKKPAYIIYRSGSWFLTLCPWGFGEQFKEIRPNTVIPPYGTLYGETFGD